MTLTVRPAGPADATALHAAVTAAFAARPPVDPPTDALVESEQDFAATLAAGGGLLAERDGEVLGGLLLAPEGDTLWLRRFGVAPAGQGHGVAGALVAAALDRVPRGVTSVAVLAREELPETVSFWRRQGFVPSATRPPYVELRRPAPASYDVPDADRMHTLGASVATMLQSGDVLVLTGELGSGKTTFTQGLGRGLLVRGEVTSPTFVIARVHPSLADGPLLVHVDAYRLGGIAELDDLDLDTSLDDAVTVVEWGEGLAEGLSDDRLEVRISRALGPATDDHDPRRVVLAPVGHRWLDVSLP
ncbi:MAG: tRNA (adenosine(37)-N6)-threonylcarbamoyltransferase complex ATPase subunit type 1 TsaE [Nocardioides sp.]